MAAAAFFRDRQGRVLLVNPSYKENWDLPGGAVEAEESPHAACRREVAEELGMDRPTGPVLAVDWVPSRPDRAAQLRGVPGSPSEFSPVTRFCAKGFPAAVRLHRCEALI
jgi:8-oxo-dGTP pyrophosphatase MutT (NUDIX family)